MLQQEREHLATLATERVAGLFRDQPGAFYQDSVRHKLIMLIRAVDRAAKAASRPILFAGIVPGIDLVVMRNTDAASESTADGDLDPRTVSAVDETCLAMLGQAISQELAQRRAGGEEDEGAFIFQGGDGLHYFGFKTLYRQAVLKEMGVSEDGLASFIPGSGSLQ